MAKHSSAPGSNFIRGPWAIKTRKIFCKITALKIFESSGHKIYLAHHCTNNITGLKNMKNDLLIRELQIFLIPEHAKYLVDQRTDSILALKARTIFGRLED